MEEESLEVQFSTINLHRSPIYLGDLLRLQSLGEWKEAGNEEKKETNHNT